MRPSGHLQVKGSAARPRWYALWRDAEGRHQRALGPAHVKPGTRRTERGAIVWRAGDGPKPGPEWLTPREARERLAAILGAAPPRAPAQRAVTVTFEDACMEWLRYVEHERQRTESTLRDYRHTVRRYLLPRFGAATPVAAITTEDVDAFREPMLEEGRLSRRSIQKILVLLHGVLQRAKREKVDREQSSRGRRASDGPALWRLQRAVARRGRGARTCRCERAGRGDLPRRRLRRPAARRAARSLPTFIALLQNQLNVAVMVDGSQTGLQRIQHMVDRGLLGRDKLLAITDITSSRSADIEDLFDEAFYLRLLKDSGVARVTKTKLGNGDRIVKRVENAFGHSFDHHRPARYLLEHPEFDGRAGRDDADPLGAADRGGQSSAR